MGSSPVQKSGFLRDPTGDKPYQPYHVKLLVCGTDSVKQLVCGTDSVKITSVWNGQCDFTRDLRVDRQQTTHKLLVPTANHPQITSDSSRAQTRLFGPPPSEQNRPPGD